MKSLPNLSVQLIHMQGPLKGQIQEFVKAEITIGRHPSCDVVFPADLQSISRQHAKLVRDGNRFKVIDSSTNGTTVNGQKVAESYLKNGDIIAFSDNGPKVSFIAQASTLQPEPAAQQQPEPVPQKAPQPIPVPPQPAIRPSIKPQQRAKPPENSPPVKANLLIQYGPTLQSYDSLPITIGSNPDCDFIITTAGICGRHAIITYTDKQYRVAELSGLNLITINTVPLTQETPLYPNDIILLTQEGPAFKFLEGGRLMQQELAEPEEQARPEPQQKIAPTTGRMQTKAKSLLGKYFNRNQ